MFQLKQLIKICYYLIIFFNSIKNSKLYAIDIGKIEEIGKCVRDYFPQFLQKYKLFRRFVQDNTSRLCKESLSCCAYCS